MSRSGHNESECGRDGTGRHSGLKSRWPARAVWVQVPPSAPAAPMRPRKLTLIPIVARRLLMVSGRPCGPRRAGASRPGSSELFPQPGDPALVPRASAAGPAASDDLGFGTTGRSLRGFRAPAFRHPHPNVRFDATPPAILHVRICAGGGWRSPSLPRRKWPINAADPGNSPGPNMRFSPR